MGKQLIKAKMFDKICTVCHRNTNRKRNSEQFPTKNSNLKNLGFCRTCKLTLTNSSVFKLIYNVTEATVVEAAQLFINCIWPGSLGEVTAVKVYLHVQF